MANQQSPKPKGYSVIEVGEDDDIEFLRKQANDIERLWLKKHAKELGFKIPHPCTYRPENRSPNELPALERCRQQRHDDAFAQYNSNPKHCLVCGEPIPYERRKVYTCSEECERNNVTEEQYVLAPKHCSICGEVIPYQTRKYNICNNCRTNTTKEAYEANPKFCARCGKKIPYDNRKGIYCSKECMYEDQSAMRADANAKSHQAAVDRYMANPHYCLNCGELVPYERRRGWFCCDACVHEYHSKQLSGRKVSPLTEEERKERKAEYMKVYRATHKEQRRVHNHTYYQRHKPEIDEKHRQYAIDHAEQTAEYQHNYREEHKEEISAQRAQHYAEHKLGTGTCISCGKQYLITNISTQLCQECLKAAYEADKGDTDYAPGKPYRDVVRKEGMVKAGTDNHGYATHHIDGIKDHDDPSNLMRLTRGDHTKIHNYRRHVVKECKEKGIEPPSKEQTTREAIAKFNIKVITND